MGDDCGDCDCDCDCDDCCECDCDDCCDCGDCDCDCDCLWGLCSCCSWDACNCNYLDNCCLVQMYVCLFCFYAPGDDTRRTHYRQSSCGDCTSCFCCDGRDNTRPSKNSPENSKDKRDQGFLWRLRSRFGDQGQTKAETAPASVRKQDGRYPVKEGEGIQTVPPKVYNIDGEHPANNRERPNMETAPPMAYRQDGRYPVIDQDGIQTAPPKVYNLDGRYPLPNPEHPKMEDARQKVYKQDGRYPMNNEGQFELTQSDYEERRRRREELYMPSRKGIMDGHWSRPDKHGNQSGGQP